MTSVNKEEVACKSRLLAVLNLTTRLRPGITVIDLDADEMVQDQARFLAIRQGDTIFHSFSQMNINLSLLEKWINNLRMNFYDT